MEATVSAPQHRADLSAGMSKANNQEFNFFGNQFLSNREPEYFVYLYNVSETKFEVNRTPIVDRLIIGPKKSGEEYTLVGKFPQPLLIPVGNIDSNEIELKPMDARRFAMDICNPDNFGLDQNAVIDPKQGTSAGTNNIGKKGVFWSINNPPKPEEVKAAIKRMEAFYLSKLEEARTVEVSAPATLKDVLGPEHHQAADYYAESFSWHGKRSKPADCPNCGSRIIAGAAFHRTDEGGMCIISWPKAVAAGVRTRAQAYEATGDEQFAPKAPQPLAQVVSQTTETAPKANARQAQAGTQAGAKQETQV
jgi:hypothetical protein